MEGSKRGASAGPTAESGDDDQAVASAGGGKPHLDRAIQAQIGDRLRAMYGELIDQPVPDRLASILDQLNGGGTSDS